MADAAWVPGLAAAAPATTDTPRHTAAVRVTHWVTTLCFFALLVSGIEIVISHPRFYGAEPGTALAPPLCHLPLPPWGAPVPPGCGHALPHQNGWSRYLHFQA